MKNLRLFTHIVAEDCDLISILRGAVAFCVDLTSEVFYFLSRDTIIVVESTLKTYEKILVELKGSIIISFEFLSDDSQLCLVLSNGTILIVDLVSNQVKEVASLNNVQISGAAWSPDIQNLLIASFDELFLFSRDFELIAKDDLRPMRDGIGQLMTIGWGSKETQFQGAGVRSKNLIDIDRIPSKIKPEFDKQQVLVSWQSDSQLFTVSSIDEIDQSDSGEKLFYRQLRVWNRNLELVSKCEPLNGMESNLCMRPTGNLIGVSRIAHNVRNICFFEPNGQYRFNPCEFVVPFNGDSVSNSVVFDLKWSDDASVLALYLMDSDSIHKLQFWMKSNYTWFEKLRLDLENPLVSWFWDHQRNTWLYFLTSDGRLNKIGLAIEYHCENMIAISIDGCKARISDLSYAPIPPPMCHYQVELGFVPSSFVQSEENGLAFISSNYRTLAIYRLSEQRRYIKDKFFELSQNDDNARIIYNLNWVDTNTLLAVRTLNTESLLFDVVKIDLDVEKLISLLRLKSPIYWHQQIPKEFSWNASDGVSIGPLFIQRMNDNNDNFSDDFYVAIEDSSAKPSSHRIWFIRSLGLIVCLNNNNNKMTVNGRLLFWNATSASVAGTDFLLVTTSDRNLYCIPLDILLKRINLLGQPPLQSLVEVRQIERGTLLVGHEPRGSRVWLQMPRGDLEVVHPRSMVAKKFKASLDSHDFMSALIEMRRHRIDTNVIYDHNPKAFLDNISLFIDQIDDADYLNLFIVSLSPEDLVLEKYNKCYPERFLTQNQYNQQEHQKQQPKSGKTENKGRDLLFPSPSFSSSDKCNIICARVRQHLHSIPDRKRFIRLYPVVLSTYLMERPKRISCALKDLKSQLTKVNSDPAQLALKWIRHLSYMVNGDLFFKEALRTYDLGIASLIARVSNKDPKEYEPILNGLSQKSPLAYQRFHIDLLAEDFLSALSHIVQVISESSSEAKKSNSDDGINGPESKTFAEDSRRPDSPESRNDLYLRECFELIEKHSLYSHAVSIFMGRPQFKEICRKYAENLFSRKLYNEAAIYFKKSGDLERAMECYMEDLNFREFINTAKNIKTSSRKLNANSTESLDNNNSNNTLYTFLRKMALKLEANDRFLEVAEILTYLDPEKNSETIINCYSKAGEWQKVVGFAGEHFNEYPELMLLAEKFLVSRTEAIIKQINRWEETLQKYAARLEFLRRQKSEQLNEIYERLKSEKNVEIDEDDNVSEASSTNSNVSRCSTASRQKRTKIERKKRRIKEGSQFEDSAILFALKNLFKEIDMQQDELKTIIPSLLSRDLIVKGIELQKAMTSLIDLARQMAKLIWPETSGLRDLPGPINNLFPNGWRLDTDSFPIQFQLSDEMFSANLRVVQWEIDSFRSLTSIPSPPQHPPLEPSSFSRGQLPPTLEQNNHPSLGNQQDNLEAHKQIWEQAKSMLDENF